MPLSRRSFLQRAAAGAVAASLPIDVLLARTSERRVPKPNGAVRLDANENAYGPPESVANVLREALTQGNRYPLREYDEFVERVAALHGVATNQVLAGCGSTEVLRICPDAFLGRGKKLIMAAPTFEAIEYYARAQNADVVKVPLAKNFSHDLDAMLARTDANTGLIYICNPNNPTASLTPRKDLDAFIAKLPASTYVLMDEAYHHFATDTPEYISFLEKPVNDPRVIVARTFSKIYGMAGIRLGYAVATPETAQKLRPCQLLDNVNILAALGGIAALADPEAMHAASARNRRDREEFMRQATARKLAPIPSYANFFMMDTGRPIRQVIEHFKQNNVLVGRRFPPLETYVRVSLGLPEEMKEFWRVWDLMPKA